MTFSFYLFVMITLFPFSERPLFLWLLVCCKVKRDFLALPTFSSNCRGIRARNWSFRKVKIFLNVCRIRAGWWPKTKPRMSWGIYTSENCVWTFVSANLAIVWPVLPKSWNPWLDKRPFSPRPDIPSDLSVFAVTRRLPFTALFAVLRPKRSLNAVWR